MLRHLSVLAFLSVVPATTFGQHAYYYYPTTYYYRPARIYTTPTYTTYRVVSPCQSVIYTPIEGSTERKTVQQQTYGTTGSSYRLMETRDGRLLAVNALGQVYEFNDGQNRWVRKGPPIPSR